MSNKLIILIYKQEYIQLFLYEQHLTYTDTKTES
jgi:hypothetical protein